jgi:hypothetical protein
VPALSCVWDSVENWAILAGQEPELYLAFRYQGGDTYFRDCGATVNDTLMNKDLFDAIADA